MSMDSRCIPRPKPYIESSPTTRPRPGGLAVYDLGLSSRVPGFESRPGRSVDTFCFVSWTGRYLYQRRVPAAVSAALRQLLWYLIAGTRGGVNRARIIEALRSRPYNAHQLSEVLGLDYRTVRHHLDLLRENGLIAQPAGSAYASPYFLTPYLEANYAIFDEIRKRVSPKNRQ